MALGKHQIFVDSFGSDGFVVKAGQRVALCFALQVCLLPFFCIYIFDVSKAQNITLFAVLHKVCDSSYPNIGVVFVVIQKPAIFHCHFVSAAMICR